VLKGKGSLVSLALGQILQFQGACAINQGRSIFEMRGLGLE